MSICWQLTIFLLFLLVLCLVFILTHNYYLSFYSLLLYNSLFHFHISLLSIFKHQHSFFSRRTTHILPFSIFLWQATKHLWAFMVISTDDIKESHSHCCPSTNSKDHRHHHHHLQYTKNLPKNIYIFITTTEDWGERKENMRREKVHKSKINCSWSRIYCFTLLFLFNSFTTFGHNNNKQERKKGEKFVFFLHILNGVVKTSLSLSLFSSSSFTFDKFSRSKGHVLKHP